MKASVIIITKNQKSYLQKSLTVLLNQNFEDKYEIIVLDSGSTDGAREYVEKLPVCLIKINSEKFNYAQVFNLGAKEAQGEYLVRLSGDAIPMGENWLVEMIKPFSDPKVGGTYGIYTISGRKGYGYPDFWPAERFPKRLTRYSVKPALFGSFETRRKVYNFAGACCAIRKNIWQKRPFNERLIGGEDAEYAWFLHLIGYDIVCNPKAKVLHEHKISKSRERSLIERLWFYRWQRIFTWEITKYWLKRIIFPTPQIVP